MDEIVDAYIDGSFINEKSRWGLIVVRDNIEVHRECGELTGEINSMRQVGGELKASIQAIAYARKRKIRVRIFFDYIGVKAWVGDIYGGIIWQPRNEWTIKYRDFVTKNAGVVQDFVKVKAHTGNFWNEAVDKLARTLGKAE